MVEGVAVTPDSKFAHASLLTRARPKIGIEQACVSPGQDGDRQAYALKAIALFAETSVRVSDGGGSPPAFTVAMLALTPDAVDVHPLSVALFDVARVAAGLGHSSGASGAVRDAVLVDVTVRGIHKGQYITRGSQSAGRPLIRARTYLNAWLHTRADVVAQRCDGPFQPRRRCRHSEKTRRIDARFRAALRSLGCLRTGQLLRYRLDRQLFDRCRATAGHRRRCCARRNRRWTSCTAVWSAHHGKRQWLHP